MTAPLDQEFYKITGNGTVEATGYPKPRPTITNPNSPHGKTFSKAEQVLMLANISEMMHKQMNEPAIARQLDVTVQTVRRYKAKIKQEWLARSAESFDAHKARELHEIDRLQLAFEKGYEESKVRRRKTATRADFVAGGRGAQGEEADPKLKPQAQLVTQLDRPEGDPRFLAGILQCIDRRIKLLGLDEPETFNITTGVGNGKGRTVVGERQAKAFALFGIVQEEVAEIAGGFGNARAAPEGSHYLRNGSGESLDSDDSYYEASGVLEP